MVENWDQFCGRLKVKVKQSVTFGRPTVEYISDGRIFINDIFGTIH